MVIKYLAMRMILFTLALLSFSMPAHAQVQCTMEAKICPDGSAVGRKGPNCEFAPCPDASDVQSIEANKGYVIAPDLPKQQFDPDLPLSGVVPDVMNVEYLVEHRTALNEQTVSIKGEVVSALLGEQACPPDRGMCAQPRVVLKDVSSQKDYNVVVLLAENDERHFYVGQTITISGIVMGYPESVMLRAPYQ